MTVKAILFDKDGTLIDFGETFDGATRYVLDKMFGDDIDALQRAAEILEFDLTRNQIANTSLVVAGSTTEIARAIAPISDTQDIDELTTQIGFHYGVACLDTVAALPDTPEALRTLLEMGLALGIATNDDEQNAKGQMERLGLNESFRHILGADSGYGAKPGPGMVTAFCQKLDLQPSSVIMVGDSTHDLDAGRAAGCITCAVETGPADASELQPHADHLLPSIGQLPALVSSLSRQQ